MIRAPIVTGTPARTRYNTEERTLDAIRKVLKSQLIGNLIIVLVELANLLN